MAVIHVRVVAELQTVEIGLQIRDSVLERGSCFGGGILRYEDRSQVCA